jgi:SAM-dependent methyltransferase
MADLKCNLCGADDYTVRFPKGYAQLHRLVVCNRCGLMYANPQELIDCERFTKADYPKVFDVVAAKQYFRKQHVQLPDNLKALAALNTLQPQRGQLLEIGSFCGIFLDRIRSDGWTVTGLEPDLGVADYARGNYGLNIVDGLLPNPALPAASYDAVMLLQVIEHMPDPAANVREIRRLLKPGGVVVVETPRFDSLMFKLLGRRERSISNCNGHIYFFTVPTLRRLLEQNGFDVVRVELVGRTLTLDRLLYNFGVMLRSDRVKRWLNAVSQKLRLEKFSVHLNARDMQRLYARAK